MKKRRGKKRKNVTTLRRKRERRRIKGLTRQARPNREAITATQRARVREVRAAEQAAAGVLATSVLVTGIMAKKGNEARQAGKIIPAEDGRLILPGAKRQP